MRPTSSEILQAIAAELETRALPELKDPWAASTVRSSLQLLRHLALRIALEPRIAADDASDVRGVLAQLQTMLSAPELGDLKFAVSAALDRPDAAQFDTAAHDANDAAAQAAIEAIVAERSRVHVVTGSTAVHDFVIAYLQRRMQRERELYLPVFVSPPI